MARLSSQEAYEAFLFFWLVLIFFICAQQHLARTYHIVIFVGLLSCLFCCRLIEGRYHVSGVFVCSIARVLNIVDTQ